ncbi:MAG: hypothetical protein HC933_06450 [Pleurocapsa sp. SU_196_0]|nr:hypothetical protein [Pleurocapsa sp. SU_196_0]
MAELTLELESFNAQSMETVNVAARMAESMNALSNFQGALKRAYDAGIVSTSEYKTILGNVIAELEANIASGELQGVQLLETRTLVRELRVEYAGLSANLEASGEAMAGANDAVDDYSSLVSNAVSDAGISRRRSLRTSSPWMSTNH